MKKITAFLILLIALLIYCVSASNPLTERYTRARNQWGVPALIWEKYRFGDLYGISFLPQFRLLMEEEPRCVQKEKIVEPHSVDVYLVHDSYLEIWFSDTAGGEFRPARAKTLWEEGPMAVCLDTTRTNILLFECAERSFRDFADSALLIQQVAVQAPGPTATPAGKTVTTNAPTPMNAPFNWAGTWKAIGDFFFNPFINRNLELNLFEYALFSPLKELKAGITYDIFHRSSPDVAVSDDGHQLFFGPTVSSTEKSGSFFPYPETEAAAQVRALNAAYRYYREAGFDEVYFTIIPNTVSLRGRKGYIYNGLVPRILNDTSRIMPMVDAWNIYPPGDCRAFYRSDTHWNINGFYCWLNEFQRNLSEVIRRKS